jgi:hypothetical protein
MPRGRALQNEGERLTVTDTFGDVPGVRRVRHGLLGVPTGTDQRDHPAAVVGVPDDLTTRDEWELGLGEIGVLDLVRVRVVDAGAIDGDQDLALTGDRVRDVADRQHLWSAELGDLNGSHTPYYTLYVMRSGGRYVTWPAHRGTR